MRLGSDKLNRALLPPDIRSKDQTSLVECVTDVTALPGMFSTNPYRDDYEDSQLPRHGGNGRGGEYDLIGSMRLQAQRWSVETGTKKCDSPGQDDQ
mgnify:CR=1 FL=1